MSKSCCDLDLHRTMPRVKLVELFSYTTICSSFKWIEPLFFELSCTHTHTHTHTHARTNAQTHTDGREYRYSIVAVDKLQL